MFSNGGSFGENTFAAQFEQQPMNGFLQASQPQNANSPGNENKPPKPKDGSSSIIPATIYMIHQAATRLKNAGPDTKPTIMGCEVHHMVFSGMVTCKNLSDENSPYVELMVDDGTAQIPCRKYYSMEDEEEVMEYEQDYGVGTWVKIVGSLRQNQNKYWIGCYDCKKCAEVDEIVSGFAAVYETKRRLEKLQAANPQIMQQAMPHMQAMQSNDPNVQTKQRIAALFKELHDSNAPGGTHMSAVLGKMNPAPTMIDLFSFISELKSENVLREGESPQHFVYAMGA